MSYCVYILYSPSTNRYYKGQTSDLKDRLNRHNNGYEKATQLGRPWQLVWVCSKDTRSDAMVLEKKLKNLSTRKLRDFIVKYGSDIASPNAPTFSVAGPDAPTSSVGGQDAD